MGRPCIFFDRDGVANVFPGEGKYVERMEDFHLHEAFFEALAAALKKGYAAVIVTNQRCIGLGRVAAEIVDAMHARLVDEAERRGLSIRAVYVCPYNDNAHPERKPNPGMLLRAAKEHDLDLTRSWMIGDSERDVKAGHGAGCRAVRIAPPDEPTQAEARVDSIGLLPGWLEANLPPVAG